MNESQKAEPKQTLKQPVRKGKEHWEQLSYVLPNGQVRLISRKRQRSAK